MTGTMPAYRGQGLGLATKVEALRRAKAAGVTEVRTDNHERNAPMLAINRRLGYQTLPAIVWLVREP
jgi:GNAT superfamily N-acetyltransferase